ncbi:GNAT family N-acetyltransferase [Staphylococcus gallinarum]|jgi:ElaA protein|uniref:Acetyltransferase n=1 Tax=Staphylococcus gallinarum TaxID=1293 RepID=A0A0D0QUB7_STAGA|nr:GNAT family N-acetyltransferase [Staphylococcus gallinarum]KIR10711.1 GCN5 family acetyltransferase [Staphylococcus gallinarum]MCD8786537.1 GNAT family N-acetyltransferase [Staphylococcus gallinarum]MCD8828729.1 GNAT family N-acetyltransferase [Staphylococcus gallinarum]MCD8859419.1 GNAT family N-acetyltransferase [Staphylococcus gallinarum]MCD8900364.1 GNAT family N-acetyltransferase [Staphylococcus gallinarum]
MEYKIVNTQHLSTIELIDIMRERIKVFVVEQNCPYQEVDEEDENALHVMLKDQNKLVAYTRIIERENDISFGRVLVTEKYRKQQYGKQIVRQTIDEIKKRYKCGIIKISGQAHLQNFYESFGFKCVSESYLEDGIPHVSLELTF